MTEIKTYKERLRGYNTISIDNIINISKELVPEGYKRAPWSFPGLEHGVAVLSNEDQLSCYMAAYGEMHKVKLHHALNKLPFDQIDDNIEIVDWGCGQGIASVCLVDRLKSLSKLGRLKKITLIEPSHFALDRAIANVTAVTNGNVEVIARELYMPVANSSISNNTVESIGVSQYITIHLFSNILDVVTIDLKKIATMIGDSGYRHLFVCIGPLNYGNNRIDSFRRYFNTKEDDIFIDESKNPLGRLANGKAFTGKMLGFKSVNTKGEPILTPISYYPAKQLFAAYKLDAITDTECGEVRSNAFDILAPFDFGASIYDDVHPILAVLNNLITRGLPTKASPFIESIFQRAYGLSERYCSLGSISYPPKEEFEFSSEIAILKSSPIAIARLQKVVLEAAMTGVISMNSNKWHVLVKENDVPCAAIAFEDLKMMFNHLTSLSASYDDMHFPDVELIVVSKNVNSPLHINAKVMQESDWKTTQYTYDMVIDIAMNTISDAANVEFSEFKVRNNCYFNVRSTATINAHRQIYTTNRIKYKTLTTRDNQGVYHPIDENVIHLEYFLNLLFRKKHFREGQLPILTRALQNLSVVGLLPTGGGKSLTYQLAAMLQPGVTIVIDPIISLMKDQYDGLIRGGIDCIAYLNSTLEKQLKKENEQAMEESRLLFVFMSPERLCIYNFRERLKNMAETNVYFSYGVVDEVHCISEWGHDFRFSYLHLGRNLYTYVKPKQDPAIPDEQHIALFGLTATASFDVLADVERELSGDNAFPLDSEAIIRYENTNRLELQYNIAHITNPKIDKKWDLYTLKGLQSYAILRDSHNKLMELQTPTSITAIKQRYIERENITAPELIESIEGRDLSINIPEDWYSDGRNAGAIVFCPHKKGSLGVYDSGKSKSVTTILKERLDCAVSCFAGGGSPTEQDNFIENKTSIMVATKAFGMGIDKPNVRFILNVNFSGSLEAFVQEAGRAGRDRKMSLATIMYCDQVVNHADWPDQNPIMHPVDYGVQDFFFQNNFLGVRFETIVIKYLIDTHSSMLKSIDNTEQANTQTSVATFIEKLSGANINETVDSYISYDSEDEMIQLNSLLEQYNLPIIGADLKNQDNRIGAYKPAISKAIYRMCCLGIIDDFTEDYVGHCFRIVAKKKEDGAYYKGLKSFLMRYYTSERADLEVKKAQSRDRGNTEMQKCLGYLTEFVYDKIAKKRKQAIKDMEAFCQEGVNSQENWLVTNERLKDFIYYYFNSKYARKDYQTENGEAFSLTDDTARGKRSSVEILFKYMKVVDNDVVGSSSPKDSIKHLQGAVRLIRRSLTDSNPTIDLLNTCCLLFLKQYNNNENIKNELEKSYKDGYKELYNRSENKVEFYNTIQEYRRQLTSNDRSIATEEELAMLEQWESDIELSIHIEWSREFAAKYLS